MEADMSPLKTTSGAPMETPIPLNGWRRPAAARGPGTTLPPADSRNGTRVLPAGWRAGPHGDSCQPGSWPEAL